MEIEESEIQRDEPRRRFTILDGLVMIVPLAVAFELARPFVKEFLHDLLTPDGTPRWFRWSGLAIGVASRFVAMGMVGLLVARLLPPRRAVRRISHEPGVVACVAAVAAMAAGGVLVLSMAMFRRESISSADSTYWPFVEARIVPAVVAAWIIQAWVGRWRPERNWIDRVGRALGCFWLVIFTYRYVMEWFWPAYWIEPR